MNLLNLSHMITEKRYHDVTILSTTILSFIIGLIVGAFLTSMIYSFSILIAVPVLISLYIKPQNKSSKIKLLLEAK